MSSPSDPLYGTLQALFGGWRTATDGTLIKPTPEAGAPPVEIPHFSVSPYVPWASSNEGVLKRNAALDQLIPLVSLVLQIKNFNSVFDRVQEPTDAKYVQNAWYLVKMAEFGSTLGTFVGALLMQHYDVCKGDPEKMAERLITAYGNWRDFQKEHQASLLNAPK